MPAELHFLRPQWLWLLLPTAFVLWRLLRGRGDGDAWRGLVDPHLLPRLLVDAGGDLRRLPVTLLGIGWLLLVVALAGPTWQSLPQPVYQAQQYRVIALDLSPSMNAGDLSPSRLAHARFAVRDLLRRAPEGQTALLAYGPEPFVVAPLTRDIKTIAAQVPSLETGLLPVQGPRRTDLALDRAGELLRQAAAPDGQVILVTDAVEHPDAASEAAQRLVAAGYTVSLLGVGTEHGAPVPAASGGLLKDPAGAIQVARLDRAALQALAAAGNGRYVTAVAGDGDIEALLAAAGDPAAHGSAELDLESDQWREEGPWLLLLLLPLAALAFRRGWFSPLLLVVLIVPPPDAVALSWDDLWLRADQQAMRSFDAGQAGAAAEQFEHPDWRAAAHYAAGDYAAAAQLLDGRDDVRAAYNRGNALARDGRLEQALTAFERALQLDPDDADARHNRDLVQRLLEQQAAQRQQQQAEHQDDDAQQGEAGGQGEQSQAGSQQDQDEPDAQDEQASAAQQGEQGETGEQAPASQQDGQGAQEQAAGQAEQEAAPGQAASSSGDDQQSAAGQADGQDGPGPDPQPAQQGAADPGGDDARQQAGQSQPNEAQADAASERDGSSEDTAQAGQQPAQSPTGTDQHTPQEAASAANAGDERDGTGSRTGDASAAATARGPGTMDPGQLPGAQPGRADLLGGEPGARGAVQKGVPLAGDAEGQQAMEQMLRRVEDDPAGLLRQRFLLQHLRRRGELP